MLKFRLIVTIVVVSLLFGCGPSKLEQTVAEGKRKLEERQERDRIKAQIESDAAEKRWQQTLVEMKRKQKAEAEQSQRQAEYDHQLSLLDAENRKLEIENELRKVEITSEKEIRITEIKSESEIKKHQIRAYERITTGRINAQANLEEAKLLSRVGVEQARMQALIGAVQMRLDSQTKSEEIEAVKQIEIAKNIASAEIARFEETARVEEIEAVKQIETAKNIASAEIARFETARVEAETAIAIVDRISRAKTQQELIKYAATVAVFSQQEQPTD